MPMSDQSQGLPPATDPSQQAPPQGGDDQQQSGPGPDQGQPQPSGNPGRLTQQPAHGSGKPPYPANQAEALKFSNDIFQILYDKRTYPGILKQLQSAVGTPLGHALALIASNIIGGRVADVVGQTGRQVEMKLVSDAIQSVVLQLGEIADRNKLFEVSDQDVKQAITETAKMIDQMGNSAGGAK